MKPDIDVLTVNANALRESADMWYRKWVTAREDVESLRSVVLSFTSSVYIKKQHPNRYAAAINALSETNHTVRYT